MASFASNWWRKHDMDRDAKGCAVILLLLTGAIIAVGGSFVCFLIWYIILYL